MSQQKLVYAIVDFLNKSLEDGTVKQDDREGLEVAGASQVLSSCATVELTAVSFSPVHWRGFWCRSF